MSKISVSVVSYLNSVPFIFGLNQSPVLQEIDLSLDIPSVCATKLIEGSVDIGLVPVAILPELPHAVVLTEYCIGASGPVKSVLLLSDVPLHAIASIGLDYQSRTSVMLTKVLAQNFWKISPEWQVTSEGYETTGKETHAVVVIGDRALQLSGRYRYSYDLAEEWMLYTRLPFVFACWVANKALPESFQYRFESAIAMGVNQKKKAIAQLGGTQEECDFRTAYVEKYISYELDAAKKEGLALFLKLLGQLTTD
jgi:chorismate dehydratase